MSNNTNITEKNYRKLVLQVGLGGFSYAVRDTLSSRIKTLKTIDFGSFSGSKVEELYWKAFLDNSDLTRPYDEIVVYHNNNLNTFVPTALFDEELAGSYLQYNTKVFETDFFAFDAIANQEMNNVYIPYVNINNYLIDQFGSFEYRHVNSILVSKLLDLSKNNDEKQVYVHFAAECFEIIVVQNQKLLLFNSFEYKTKEDFIYYLLFTAEQLNLNPEYFKLHLLGAISEDSEFYKVAYKYVRNVDLLDTSVMQLYNDFSKAENLKHFILFQS
ncbi:DUF3822 family protein [Flavobacterium sp. 3HN19-14]|uniref:DUF3822 family protein n=1 Tax=Flavobacterium sp. 3HN19-14 TaxID=3448133 RepID=UPI003EE36778